MTKANSARGAVGLHTVNLPRGYMATRHSKLLSAQDVRQFVEYNPDTGVVQKKLSVKTRYKTITVLGQTYPEHWIAWLLHTGDWPKLPIDHINGDRHDNRICNLREVTGQENSQNQRKAHRSNKSTGVLGVSRRPSGKFDARLQVNGRNLHLGTFATVEEASAAYLAAKRAHHSGCTL